jgi:hypothetical protein
MISAAGGEFGQVNVRSADELPHEEWQVGPLREAGQLDIGLEANVDELRDAMILEQSEEALGGLLRESDRVELDHASAF